MPIGNLQNARSKRKWMTEVQLQGSASPSNAAPLAAGVAAAGVISNYSRGDHVHPLQDVSGKQDATLPAGWAGAGSVARPVAGKLGETVSVADFGAVGDGFSDNLAAINAAQAALSAAGGGTLLYPPGRYRISAAILCSNNIRHLGAGRRATVIENTGAAATARLNDCFNIGAMSINNIDDFTSYAGTLSTDRRTITLTTGGAGANFAVGEVAFLGATATVTIAADTPAEQGFMVYISAIAGNLITFEAPLPENVVAPKLFKFSGVDGSTGYNWHVGHHIEIANFTFAKGSAHIQGAYGCYIHDIDIEDCRNFVAWNTFCRSTMERINATYWNRAIEIKLFSHESVLRDIKCRWYDGGGATALTQPVSFGEMSQRITLDNVEIITNQLTTAVAYLAVQYARYIDIVNCRFHFLNMPAVAVIEAYDGLSALAKTANFSMVNCEVKVGGVPTRFLRTSDASPSNPPNDVLLRGVKFLGTVSSLVDAINFQGGDRLQVISCDLPTDCLIAVSAAATNVVQPSPAGLAFLAIDKSVGFQVNSRTVLGTSASAGHLGVAAPYGSAAITRAANGTATTEQGLWYVRVPDDFATNGTLRIRIRARYTGGPPAVAATLTISVKEVGDNGVNTELYSAGTQAITGAATDYDLTFASTAIVAGDMLAVVVTCAIDDTGGATATTGQINALKLLYSSTLRGR